MVGVVMLTTNRAVLIRYMRDGKPRRGSGLQVAGQFVLTADHCADGTGHMLVTGGGEYPAEVYVRSRNADVDLAVLWAHELPLAQPLRCALVDRKAPKEVKGCHALGFPVWKESAQGPRLAQVPGNIPTAEGVDPRADSSMVAPMSLKISHHDIRERKVPEGELDQAGSPWAGMSGAVVVTADDLIVGVIRSHSAAEGTGSLTATRIESLASLPAEVAQLFLSALQMPDLGRWPMVPSPSDKDGEGRGKPERERPLSPVEFAALRPHIRADRLARMPHDEAVSLLVTAPVRASTEALQVLLRPQDEGLAISLLADINREQAEELIAAMTAAPDWLKDLPNAADAIADEAVNRYVELGMEIRGLVRAAHSERRTEGYYKTYERGLIHWCASGGAQPTKGEICEYHVARGGSGSQLGFPLTPEMSAARSSPFGTDGLYQRFESSSDYDSETCGRLGLVCGSTVYWSKYGAHATEGEIGAYYEAIGGTNGPLGFPVTDAAEMGPIERRVGDGASGWYQRFEGGTVYWSEKTKAIAVHSPVADYRDRHGGLGFPVSPMLVAAPNERYGAEGHFQRFEAWEDYPEDIISKWSDQERPGGATVYTSDAHGTHCVGWGNGIAYERMSGTSSWLGFPKSDETDARTSEDEPRSTIQEFEGGAIFYKDGYGSVLVSAAIMEYLSQHDDLRRQVGFPVKEARSLVSGDGEQVQFFEHGIITSQGDTIEAWLRWDDLAKKS